MMNELGIETGIDISKVLEIGRKAEQLTGHSGTSFVLRAGTSADLVRRISGTGK